MPYEPSVSKMLIPDMPSTQDKRFRNLMYHKASGSQITHRLFIFANPKSGS